MSHRADRSLRSLLDRKNMESVNLDMEDIFEEEDFPSVGPLPDLPEDDVTEERSAENEDDAENSEVLSKLKDLSKGAAKKVVRRPQPKLDSTRLTGDRGIPILPNVYKDVKFKGKGYEAQDLGIVMRYLEHWTHRLFPKMPFDEVLERIEKLGTKKEVQTCIKKMRMDMPILNNDFVEDEDDEMSETTAPKEPGIDPDAEDVWDEMIRQEDERAKGMNTPAHGHVSQLLSELAKPLAPATPCTNGTILSASSTPDKPVINGPHVGGLTPEQRERIERNKRLAMEKRLGKSVFKVPATPSAIGSPTQASRINSSVSPSQRAVNCTQEEYQIHSQGEGSSSMPSNVSQESFLSGDLTLRTTQESESAVMSEIIPILDKKSTNVMESSYSMSGVSTDDMCEVVDKTSIPKQQNNMISPSELEDTDMSEVIPVVGNAGQGNR